MISQNWKCKKCGSQMGITTIGGHLEMYLQCTECWAKSPMIVEKEIGDLLYQRYLQTFQMPPKPLDLPFSDSDPIRRSPMNHDDPNIKRGCFSNFEDDE